MGEGTGSTNAVGQRNGLPWFGLFAVVTLGVMCGNLLSTWVTSAVVQYQVESAMREFSERTDRMLDQQRARTAEQRARRREESIDGRRASDTGKELARRCAEWRTANENLGTYTTRTNMQKYCSAYREYLETGTMSVD